MRGGEGGEKRRGEERGEMGMEVMRGEGRGEEARKGM